MTPEQHTRLREIEAEWVFVCEENTLQRRRVTESDWNQWVKFRNDMNRKLKAAQKKSPEEYLVVLESLSSRISSARRG